MRVRRAVAATLVSAVTATGIAAATAAPASATTKAELCARMYKLFLEFVEAKDYDNAADAADWMIGHC